MNLADKHRLFLELILSRLTSPEEQQNYAEFVSDLESLSCPPLLFYDSINLTPDDLEGLPPEVIEQLGLNESDYYEMELVRLINKVGGVVSLDKLIVLLYKEKNEVAGRTPLNARLYRMMKKSLVYSVPGKKGVYSTKPMEG